MVLLLDFLIGNLTSEWPFRELLMLSAAQDFALMMIFGWMALRGDRWWPIVVTASLTLSVLARVIGMLNPDLSVYATLSAVLGFWILIYVVVLAGVGERWLAGEKPVSGAAVWRRRHPAP